MPEWYVIEHFCIPFLVTNQVSSVLPPTTNNQSTTNNPSTINNDNWIMYTTKKTTFHLVKFVTNVKYQQKRCHYTQRSYSTALSSRSVVSQPYVSYNPYNGQEIKRYDFVTPNEIDLMIQRSHDAFLSYRNTSFRERRQLLLQLANVLEANKEHWARIITEEMGKPIVGAIQEVEKCALNCTYFANEGERMAQDEPVDHNAKIVYLPMGPILQLAPFNFPFWQVIRFAAPALMAGNVLMIRHSHCTPRSAEAIQKAFDEAMFPNGIYQNVFADNDSVARIIADPRVRGVTFTGSTETGKKIGEMAAKNLKKHVLELGGSDAFIVLKDANLNAAVETAVTSRTLNNGQSCIAAKRFIVEEPIYDEFVHKFTALFKKLEMGDPLDKKTDIGPMARADLRDKLHKQVTQAIAQGAKLVMGGKIPEGPGFFYPPTILTEVDQNNVAFTEESFGPVAAIIRAKDMKHAVELANMSEYGLGSTVFTEDDKKGEWIARELDTGLTFINGICRSAPHLPFGGQKNSGYGRECSTIGLREWTNIKTVWKRDGHTPKPKKVE